MRKQSLRIAFSSSSSYNTLYNPFKVGFKRVPSYSNVIYPDDTEWA